MAPAGFVSFKNTHQTHPFCLKQQRRRRRRYKPQLSLFLCYFRSQKYFFELNLIINTILWGWEAAGGRKVHFNASLQVQVQHSTAQLAWWVQVVVFCRGRPIRLRHFCIISIRQCPICKEKAVCAFVGWTSITKKWVRSQEKCAKFSFY